MTELALILDGLLRLPEGQVMPPGQDLAPFYRPWGFTVYRTAYGPATDECWDALVGAMHAQVREQLHSNEDVTTARRLISLFQLDECSDPAGLARMSTEAVRQVHRTGGPENTGMLMDESVARRCFLLADEEVLAEVAKEGNARENYWVKCVEADYDPPNHVPRNTRLSRGQRYFGWMKMTTRSLLDLWESLMVWDLSRIAPQTIGGMHLEVWDGATLM